LLGDVVVPLPGGMREDELTGLLPDRHRPSPQQVDLDAYEASGLPTRVMGRALEDDRLFFAAPLASGRALAEAAAGVGGG
jgi:hypothetical protein